MTQVTSAHLGESLGTDFFSVREQFTDEQWEHFITVRRFADEEVVPVVGPYWERSSGCPSSASSARTSRATGAPG
jgi:glutaryl-CoA dehydrogenase